MTRRLVHLAALLLAAAAGAGVAAHVLTADPPPAGSLPEPVAIGREVAPAPRPTAPPPQPFRFAGDRGGKQVERALTPTAPIVPPPAVTGPRPRSSAAEPGEFALPASAVAAIPLPLTPRRSAPPTPPPERVPAAATATPVVRLPEGPLVADRKAAADGLPPLAKQVPDRASTDDPTAGLSAARIVNTVLPVPALAVPFLKLVIPDPFELAEQIRMRPVPELATTPVTVPPARP